MDKFNVIIQFNFINKFYKCIIYIFNDSSQIKYFIQIYLFSFLNISPTPYIFILFIKHHFHLYFFITLIILQKKYTNPDLIMLIDQLSDIFQSQYHLDQQSQDNPDTIIELSPKKRFQKFNQVILYSQYKTVSRAYDAETGRQVSWNAIKIDRLLPTQRKILLKQIALMKTFNHKHILKCIDSWVNKSSRQIIYITELVSGGILKSYLRKIKPPKLKIIKIWCEQILNAINYLHSHGHIPILHKNIKCENLYINTNSNQIKMGELGVYISNLRHNNPFLTSYAQYEPPQLAYGKTSQCSDVYSFGMLLLEITTMQIPYQECRSTCQIYKKILSGTKPLSLEKISNIEIKNLISKCIGDQNERPTIKQLLQNPIWKSNDDIQNSIMTLNSIAEIKNKNDLQKSITKSQKLMNDQKLNNDVRSQVKKKNFKNLKIQIEQDQKITRINSFMQMIEKQSELLFSITMPSKKNIQIKISKINHSKQLIQEFLLVYIPKFEQIIEKRMNSNRQDQTTSISHYTKSELETKKQCCSQNKIKQEENAFVQSHDLLELNSIYSSDILNKIKNQFNLMYQQYQTKIQSILIQNQINVQQILEIRFNIQKKQLQNIQYQERQQNQHQKKRNCKKMSRVTSIQCPPSPSEGLNNLIDFLNLQYPQISIVDNSQMAKCEAFKNIMHNGDIAFNDSSIYNARGDELTNNLWFDNLKAQQQNESIESKHEKCNELKGQQLGEEKIRFFTIPQTKQEQFRDESLQFRQKLKVQSSKLMTMNKNEQRYKQDWQI